MADCHDRLDSWKEIAAYLKRQVRTVQLWEKTERLPIHRHFHNRGGTVYAFRSELDDWWRNRHPTEAPAFESEGWLPLQSPAAECVPSSHRVMVAVLPFENLNGDSEQEYFSDGMTEEMISQLGRLAPRKLGIIARTSAMCYKHTRKSIAQIASELGVNYILEGSVRRSANQVRIAIQLVNARDQSQLWAATHDQDLVDVLKIQTDVAARVVRSITPELLPQAGASLCPQVRPEAHEAYLKGRYFSGQRTEESLHRASACFARCIQYEPRYAPAYSGLADCYTLLAYYSGLRPQEAGPKASAAALKALELDPTLGEAHASLADIRAFFEWDWSGAEQQYCRAIECNPSYATAYHWYANYLAFVGRCEEAILQIERARQFDPLSLVINVWVGMVCHFASKNDQTIDECRKVLEMDPNYAVGHWVLGRAYEQKRMFPESIAEFQKAVEMSGGSPSMISALGHAYGFSGDRCRALEMLSQLKSRSRNRYVPPHDVALVYAGLDEKEHAIDWLTKAFEERSAGMAYLEVDPRYNGLRSDRRYRKLVKQLGLPLASAQAS